MFIHMNTNIYLQIPHNIIRKEIIQLEINVTAQRFVKINQLPLFKFQNFINSMEL